LNGELDQKAVLLERCQAAEERVSGLERLHDEQCEELKNLNVQVHDKENEIADLQSVAQRLSVKSEDERRLRAHVAELAREVSDTQSSIEAEKSLSEQREREREAEIEQLQLELQAIQNETTRIRESGNLELDTLSRRCQQMRADIADKEALLNNAVNENAAKQSAIAQFEEEKRRIDREQLARKAAAAHAAKAALSELNY
jgi:DNA repair exonuclease SbcCD ATPase subunit